MANNKTNPSFLHLPPEIRTDIYERVFWNHEELIPSTPRKPSSGRLSMLLTCRTIYKECRKTAFRNTVFHITTSLSVDESADRDSVVTYQSRVLRQGLSAHHESGLLSLVTHISISRGLHEAIFVAASLDSEVDSLATLLSQALPAVEYIFLDYTTPPAPRQDGPRPSSREGNWLERYSPSCQAIAGAVKIFPLLSQLVLLDHHRDEGRYGQNGLSNMLLTFGDFVERAFEPERISINECVDRMSICLEVRITSPSLMRKFGNIKHVHVHYAVIARLWERLDAPWINECPVDDGRRPADYRLMARDDELSILQRRKQAENRQHILSIIRERKVAKYSPTNI